MTAESPLAGFRRWRGLLFDLAAEVHPERWAGAGISPAARARLIACERSRRALSRDVSWLGPAAGDWDLTAGGVALWALEPAAALWKRGLLAAAAAQREVIARMVWRREIEDFKETVGEDVYLFALRQAPLALRGVSLFTGDAGGTAGERVSRSAGLALGCWLAGLEPNLAARAILKLPPSCDAAADEAATLPEDRRREWLEVLERVAVLAANHTA